MGCSLKRWPVVISDVPNNFGHNGSLAPMCLCNKPRLFEEISRTAPKKAVTKLPSNQGRV